MQTERGIILTIILVIIAALITLTLIGFFNSGVNNSIVHLSPKSILREPCGLSVDEPDPGDNLKFPLVVDGYINGCGWEARNNIAGSVILFADNGFELTPAVPLLLPPQAARNPYYFKTILNIVPPASAKHGLLLFKNNSGNGLEPMTFQVKVDF